VHLGIGAGFGALFALLARALRLRGAVAVLVGAAYGLAVMALMGLVLIPSLAGETAGDQLIADAPALIGWPVATVAHLVFGLILGVWTAVVARRPAPAADATPRRQPGKPVS
jgi:MFS family permease